MGAAVKGLPDVPVAEKVMVRNLISLFIAGSLALRAKVPLWGTTSRGRILLTIRSALGLCGVLFIFYTTTKLPLADSALFMRLSPFWVTILAALFLHEKITPFKVVALLFAFGGTIIIMRPTVVLSLLTNSSNISQALPFLSGLIASLCAAGAYTVVSKLRSYEKPETIVFCFSFFSVIATLPFVIKIGYIPSLQELGGLTIVGLAAASGQMFLTHAYRMGKASEISIFNYIGILFSIIIGFFWWHEIPDTITLLGGSFIIIAGIIVYHFGKEKA